MTKATIKSNIFIENSGQYKLLAGIISGWEDE